MTIHTLRTIAEEFGVEKRTTQNWYARAKEQHGEFGTISISGTRQFSDEERNLLIGYASPVRQSSTAPVEVSVGGAITLASPHLPDTYSLDLIRGTQMEVLEEPLQIADQFLVISDQLIQAMQQDISTREQRLSETRKAKSQIAEKAQELQLETRLYKLQSSQVNDQINLETRNLQRSLKELGKFEKSS